MKNVLTVLIVLITLTSCQDQKIGYVDNGKVINDIQEKKDIEAKYEALNKTSKAKTDSIAKSLQEEYIALQKKVARMSQRKQQELARPFQLRAQKLEQEIQAEQNQMQTAYQTEIDSVISKMKTAVKDYAKANGYGFVIGTNESIGTVLYGKEGSDISDIIIKEINANYEKK